MRVGTVRLLPIAPSRRRRVCVLPGVEGAQGRAAQRGRLLMPYTDLDGYDVYNDMMANGGPGLHERRRSYPMGRSLDSERDVTVKAVNGRGFQTELGDW